MYQVPSKMLNYQINVKHHYLVESNPRHPHLRRLRPIQEVIKSILWVIIDFLKINTGKKYWSTQYFHLLCVWPVHTYTENRNFTITKLIFTCLAIISNIFYQPMKAFRTLVK